MIYRLPAALREDFDRVRRDWVARDGTRRLWARDAALWTGGDEGRWLGWLDLPFTGAAALAPIERLAEDVAREGFTDAVVLGMGGSSLGPFVMSTVLEAAPGRPRMHVLDSTDPGQIRALESRLDLPRTLFIVASKSGSTLEPSLMRDHFLAAVRAAAGTGGGGRQFIAITDPGSKLEAEAKRDDFRAVVLGEPTVGGRFSSLSPFGLVPAAIMGADLRQLLEGAAAMANASRSGGEGGEDGGVSLGLLLAAAARGGLDKLTLILSPRIEHLGIWLEQLVAESTGKQGRVILPVDHEAVGAPAAYGRDRLFVYACLADGVDTGQERMVAALEAAGFPVARLLVAGPYGLGAEFFRWEIATAVAGAVLGIHPFDQPDVEAAKLETRRLTDAVERDGSLPRERPFFEAGGVQLFADEANTAALQAGAAERTLAGFLGAHLDRLVPGDYFALLAYLPMDEAHASVLQTLRHRVRDERRVATTLGFGPRYLHSTGQAHKGGPNSGVFLQVTREVARDLPVDGRTYSFGIVEAAQARGDFAVLCARGRRALRVHLGADGPDALRALDAVSTVPNP